MKLRWTKQLREIAEELGQDTIDIPLGLHDEKYIEECRKHGTDYLMDEWNIEINKQMLKETRRQKLKQIENN